MPPPAEPSLPATMPAATKLYEEGAVSASLWDQYRTEEEAASAALSQASASLQTAQNQLSYTELTADHDAS